MAQEFYEDVGEEGDGGAVGGSNVTLDGSLVFDRSRRVIRLTKGRLLPEDTVAFKFARVLEEGGVSYVVVAGYTAILFGRGRRSDDIDFIIEEIDEDGFLELCRRAREAGFALMQGDIWSEDSVRRLYRSYLAEGYGVRFMYRDIVLPNIEVKLAGTSAHRYALANSVRVVVNDRFAIRVSPLELQIAYKLYLGSEKDVGDAVFLYTLFKDHIDRGELEEWCTRLRVNCRILGEAGKP
ncbi:MAG: hypothetical protein DSY37_04500 [Hyperthermus sp.]|nr:MAG: hypothetical protein DSY37_04500 [Hyperthermus sp.]